MRDVLFVVLSTLLLPLAGVAQTESTQTNTEGLSCFETLAPPEYPRTALQSNVDGSVWTWTQVSPQGTVNKIETQVVSAWGIGPKLLVPPVEKAIRAAKIKSSCAGKTIAMVFRYDLRGDATPNPKVTSRTEAPNMMWIQGQPAAARTTSAAAGKAE